MVEILTQPCIYCKENIEFEWDDGVVSRPDFVLIADFVAHAECFDKDYEEYERQQKKEINNEQA